MRVGSGVNRRAYIKLILGCEESDSRTSLRAADLCARMAELSARGECFATITIVGSKGFSPRGLGAKMVVREDGSSYFVIPRPGTLT
jgi:hypothetical protein